MSENWRQPEICIGIYDKSQGSATKQVGMAHFITNLSFDMPVKQFLKIAVTFGEDTGKMVDRVIRPIRLILLSSKMQNSPDK